MQTWNLMHLPPSTEKSTPRAPGPDAPRKARHDGQMPQVLFSTSECRGVVIDLARGGRMDEHQVHERAVVQIVMGRVSITSGETTVECECGSLVVFEPNEVHAVHAIEDARLLLLLAPWPAPEQSIDPAAQFSSRHVPANARVSPTQSSAD